MSLIKSIYTSTNDNYAISEVAINVPDHDTDVILNFPNGEKVTLQWRVESESLDVCLPRNKHAVTCWEGSQMKPAKADKKFDEGHVRKCGQLVIDLSK